MKNLKNTLVAVGLAPVLGVGSVSASTGLIISDRYTSASTCTAKDGGILQQIAGILSVGLNGLMISDLHGLILSDAPVCTETNGIMISDRNGKAYHGNLS